MPKIKDKTSEDIIALIPAAGQARRLGTFPGSKEVTPLTWIEESGVPRPRLACDFLLEALNQSGIDKAIAIVDEYKCDLVRYFARWQGSPSIVMAPIAESQSVPQSLSRALPWTKGKKVALGFPDVVFEPVDAYRQLIEAYEVQKADLVLGLFPASHCANSTDMVELDDCNRVLRIESRPQKTQLRYNWLLALWGPSFSEALLKWLPVNSGPEETRLSSLFTRAIQEGMNVSGVRFPRGKWWDLGTPKGFRAVQKRILEII